MSMETVEDVQKLRELARAIRINIIKTAARVKSSHIGGSFSSVDLLTAMYFNFLRVDPNHPNDPNRDRLVFSKGHCALALYAALAARGFAPESALDDYFADGSLLTGHPTRACLPGVEVTSGSLGHGLPMGAGLAYAAQLDGSDARAVVLVSDGECDSGATWEAAMFAGYHKLDNLLTVVDYNKLQGFGRTEEVMNLEPFAAKWESSGWSAREINGHDFTEILQTLRTVPFDKGKPSVIIAHTIKGKGISFMENTLASHYDFPTPEQLARAIGELEASA